MNFLQILGVTPSVFIDGGQGKIRAYEGKNDVKRLLNSLQQVASTSTGMQPQTNIPLGGASLTPTHFQQPTSSVSGSGSGPSGPSGPSGSISISGPNGPSGGGDAKKTGGSSLNTAFAPPKDVASWGLGKPEGFQPSAGGNQEPKADFTTTVKKGGEKNDDLERKLAEMKAQRGL